MSRRTSSLHRLVDKWFGPSLATPLRVVRVKNSGAQRSRCICVEGQRPLGRLSILFFRHGDGTWRVFPPSNSGPSMSALRFGA